MRYLVRVTKVEAAERWIRSDDEESAAQKVRDEMVTPWAWVGSWERLATEVQVVGEGPPKAPPPNPLSETGAMLHGLREAASALGVPYSALYAMTNRGEIEYTLIGSRKYISRETLAAFVRDNTHRGPMPSKSGDDGATS
ncbi:helix-turn-helix domain-containing protein [Microbacterium sp. ZW T2_14]|uniref:helix-turn-helix domain-containing protein n=1 Tax=Microbacterium sp. ZW T2_14 TaxID=3378079 RepID=UPI003851CD47